MLVNEISQEEKHVRIVVRLLNGFLRGCEFTLSEGRTLFLVSNEENINKQHKGTLLPDNTIYIPCESGEHSFEITVTPDNPLDVAVCDLQQGGELKKIESDSRIAIGEIEFAWRQENETFSEDVLGDKQDKKAEIQTDTETWQERSPTLGWVKYVAVAALASALFVAGYIYQTATQRQINSVATLLNFAPHDYQIIAGQDRQLYIFASTDKAADWAVQTLVRNPPSQQAHVLSQAAEQQRVASWIESHWPQIKFHRVKLAAPQSAVIQLSAERTRLTEREKESFIASLKRSFPYMSDVILGNLDDATVKTLAAQGLKKLALSFNEINNGDSVTFVISGVIEDGLLESIKNFVEHYYQIWGGRYVNFSLELQTDWFKDKSFKFGEHGYIKLGSGHWFFPNTSQKEK